MNNVVIENAHMGPASFRNFSGRETQFNRKGDRNFVLFLDNDKAREMESAGWPVRWKPDRYNEGEQRAQMKVNVKYTARDGRKVTPPKIVVCSSKGKVPYDEEMVGMIDAMEIEKCDLILSPYSYTTAQGSGTSAYLKTMYITLAEDELDAKYADNQQTGTPADDIPW